MNKQGDFYKSDKKIPLRDTKVAYYWSVVLYVLSAVTFAEALVGFTNQAWGETLNDLGLTLIFIVLSTRGEQIAAYAYIKDPLQKDKAISSLIKKERVQKPWLRTVIATGWLMMFAGIAYELII